MANCRFVSRAHALAAASCLFVVAPASAQWATMDIHRIGLVDADHGPNLQRSYVSFASSTGDAAGFSDRFAKGGGLSAWFWSRQLGTVMINPVDALHQGSTGQIRGGIYAINNHGRVAGGSCTYAPGLPSITGFDAWTWTASSGTATIGYVSPQDPGLAHNRYIEPIFGPRAINQTGDIIGTSVWSTAAGVQSTDAWVWSASLGNIRLGYVDADHTQANGAQISKPVAINDAGMIIGYSQRRTLASGAGRSAWIWSLSDGYARVGFTDAAHTGPDGFQDSYPNDLSQDGRVVGASVRFVNGVNAGYSAWIWNPQTGAAKVGPTAEAYTRDDGYQEMGAIAINAAGQICGSANRYTGAALRAIEIWFQNPGLEPLIAGLYDAQHTALDGTSSSQFGFINSSGQVVGRSFRYYTGSAVSSGYSGWFFDPATNTTTPLVFSVSTSGVSKTDIAFLTDTGVVGGTYEFYQGNTLIGRRAFLWSQADGYIDPTALIDGGAAAHGWTILRSLDAAGADTFFGSYSSSTDNPGGWSAFVLSPHKCLADLNSDDDVTLEDFMDFFVYWDASAPRADVDDWIGVDLGDFFAFLDHWDQGC